MLIGIEPVHCCASFFSLSSCVADETPQEYDNRHEAAVVLLGAVGKHLSKEDPLVLNIADSLVTALRVPSESVQRAVADGLVPLIQAIKTTEKAKEILERLIQMALEGETYGDRRGAAFGVSACVKGLGIPALKQYDIVTRLKDACATGSVNNRS